MLFYRGLCFGYTVKLGGKINESFLVTICSKLSDYSFSLNQALGFLAEVNYYQRTEKVHKNDQG